MKPLGTLRFFLAFCVLGGHAYNLLAASVPPWASSVGAIAAQLGVLMFFTVSGYIICFAIEQNYASRPVAFLANRALRIFPVHLACYALSILFLWETNATPYGWVPKISLGGASFVADLLILPSATFLPNPPMWSVGVEMQFYVLMGLATFAPWRRGVYWLLGAAVSLAAIFDVPLGTHGQFFCFFAIGGSLFYVRTRFGMLLGCLALAAVVKYTLFITNRIDIPNVTMTVTIVLALGLLAWLVLSDREAGKVDGVLGNLSYPLYAVHVPILAVIAQGKTGVPWWLTVCAICVMASIALHLLVERPAMRLRSRLRRSAPALPPLQQSRPQTAFPQ